MNTSEGPNGQQPGKARLELARRSALLELAGIFGEQLQVIALDPPVVEVAEARLICQLNREWERHRSRVLTWIIAGAVSAVAALWLGYLFGSGAFNARDRYNAERLSTQRGERVQYGPSEVYGHPGAAIGQGWQPFQREVGIRDEVVKRP